MRIFVAQLNPTIGDLEGNTAKVLHFIEQARKEQADLVLFPELILTGYPPQDLLLLPHFLDAVENQLQRVTEHTKGITAVVGAPRREDGKLYNSAFVLQDGKVAGAKDKILLPTYDVFNERRFFSKGSPKEQLWSIGDETFALTICEDIWGHTAKSIPTTYGSDPIKEIAALKPDYLLNLSASPFSSIKLAGRIEICRNAAQAVGCPLVFCNQVGANDSLLFDGHSLVVDPKGVLLTLVDGFAEDSFLFDTEKPQKPYSSLLPEEDAEIYHALVMGVRDYFAKSGFSQACLGLSGGIDSAVVACIAAEALGKDNVLAVSMPSRYTQESSRSDAQQLAQTLGLSFKEISIDTLFDASLNELEPHFHSYPPDITEENLQSRIRGTLLMALSNKYGCLVLGTGNKSELGMGYATLYGDMIGGLSVINDLTKGQVYALARWINRQHPVIPQRIIDKAPSAELRPNQKDSDSLPEYDVLDAVLHHYVVDHQSPQMIAEKTGYPLPIVEEMIRRIHRNEYKRRQAPPGLRVSEKAFSIGRQFPIVQKWV